MKNTTLTFDEFVLEKARLQAGSQGLSLNAWVNKLVIEAIESSQSKIIEEAFAISDHAKGNSKGQKWTRDDIYER